MIIYRKVGIKNIILKYLLNVALSETAIIGLVAVLRIPIADYTIAMLVVIYGILLITQSYNLKIELDKIKLDENNK